MNSVEITYCILCFIILISLSWPIKPIRNELLIDSSEVHDNESRISLDISLQSPFYFTDPLHLLNARLQSNSFSSNNLSSLSSASIENKDGPIYRKSTLIAVLNDNINIDDKNRVLRSLLMTVFVVGFISIDVNFLPCSEAIKIPRLANLDCIYDKAQNYDRKLTCGVFLFFDDPAEVDSFEEIIITPRVDPDFMRSLLENRYGEYDVEIFGELMDEKISATSLLKNEKQPTDSQAAVRSDESHKSIMELKWAHARGNYKLYSLGSTEDLPAILSATRPVKQFTRAGHLFCVLNSNSSSKIQLDQNGDTAKQYIDEERFPPRNLVGFYVIPAIKMKPKGKYLKLYTHNMHCKNEYHSDLCQKKLLRYFAEQRHSQVWINSWYLPNLFNFLHPFSSNIGRYTGYKVITLPSRIFANLRSSYQIRRKTLAVPESIISTVFNQIEVETYYVSLPNQIMDELQTFIFDQVSKWLQVNPNSLVSTGSYGVREYRKGAVIRWHVDPVETQPITAIIHVAHGIDDGEEVESLEPAVEGNFEFGRECAKRNNSEATSLTKSWYWPLSLAKINLRSHTGLESEELASNIIADLPPKKSYCDSDTWTFDLKEGRAILFESARIPHARLEPLKHKWSGNIFFHFKPNNWDKEL